MKVGYIFDSGSSIPEISKGDELLNRIEFVNFTVMDPEMNEYSKNIITIDKYDLVKLFNKFPKKGLKTSLTPRDRIEIKIREMLKKYDCVLGCPISCQLSGQYNLFVSISQNEEFKNKFFVYGKKNAGITTYFEIDRLDKLLTKENKITEEVYTNAVKEVESKVFTRAILFVSDLYRLTLSGRISTAKGLIGRLASLKVSFALLDDQLKVIGKARSSVKLLHDAIVETKKEINQKLKNAKISATMYMFQVKSELRQQLEEIAKDEMKIDVVQDLPAIYAVHLGEGVFGILLTAEGE